MRVMRLILLLFLFGLVYFDVQAQSKVGSEAYNKMLTGLLEHNVPEVNVDEVEPGVTYLDTRELHEYKISHIKGAIWVGYTTFKLSRIKEVSKNAKVVVYCSVGYRSEKITQRLIKKGYSDVGNLYGGLFEWVNQGKEVVNSSDETTLNIHAYDEEWGVWLRKGIKVY